MQTIEHENQNLLRAGYPPLADCEPLHTPGPWAKEGATVCQAETLQTICKTLGKNEEIQSANARLISAAPELLSALQQAYNAIAWDIPGGNLSDEEEEELLDTLRSAIAKAEGRAE